MKKKILIVDDHKIIADGMKLLIDKMDGFEVVDNAVNGQEALQKFQKIRPQILLLDNNLPDCEGIDLIPDFLKIDAEIKIIILTSYVEPSLVIRAITAGAKSFLTKNVDEKTIELVLNNIDDEDKNWIDPAINFKTLAYLISHNSKRESKEDVNIKLLSEEERQIIYFISEGNTNKEIAEKLFVSEHTIKNYISKIFKTLKLRNRSEIASFAVKNKLLE